MATAIPEKLDRQTLLALTPDKYLSGGYHDENGAPRPELRSIFATAAATQLEASEASPQELAATLEALRQVLPLHEGTPAERALTAVDEALLTVAAMYHIDNNPGIASFVRQCAAAVQSDGDLKVMLDHVQATVRQYGVFVALGNG